jgi:hypothetical protein
MSYFIYIERDNSPISLEEWKHAVSKIEGVKLHAEPIEAINPSTNQLISISSVEGTVAVLFKSGGFLGFASSEEWVPAIQYQNGRAYIKATEEIENKKNPIRNAVSKIAQALSATIRGEEGEEYIW